jgi:hypothetical protein
VTTEILTCASGPELPALIAHAGERAAWRFLEFFTVNIRNKNTRAAYARAAGAFLRRCEGHRIGELERRIEVAQRMAGHSNAKTIGLYDRRNDDISVGEVERIGI